MRKAGAKLAAPSISGSTIHVYGIFKCNVQTIRPLDRYSRSDLEKTKKKKNENQKNKRKNNEDN